VPADKIAKVLGLKSVLLSREQYDTLLRDAGVDKPSKPVPPADAVLSSAVWRAVPDGKTAVIHAELIVNVLGDDWCELPLDLQGAAIGEAKLDGEGVLMPKNAVLRADSVPAPAKGKAQEALGRPSILVIRGRGQHRLSLDITAPIQSATGLSSLALVVPNAASGTFTLALPAGATMEKSALPMKVSTAADATTATLALSPSQRTVSFAWRSGAAAGDAQVPVRAQAKVRYAIDAEKITGTFLVRIESALGNLPVSFEFSLPPEVKVLAVRADELRGWESAGGKTVATFQPGERKSLDLEIDTELSALAGKDSATVALALPVFARVPRLEGLLFVTAADDVIVKDIAGDAALSRVPTPDDRGERGFFGAYEFSGRAAGPRVTIERAMPKLEADLDTLVEFRTDAIYLTRTVTLREQKGRRFSVSIALPGEEELIEVRRIEEAKVAANQAPAQGIQPANTECEPEWTQEAGKVLIKWSDESAKPRVFRLRTRVEPEKWTQLPAEGTTFTLGDAKISDASKVAGYIALVADAAFRLEAQPGETLERRDGRSTPVRGDYAWFRRDAFDLKVKIARRPAEVLAALTGYVLPLEGLLDVHASMNYQFLGGGSRSVRIRVPQDIAQNFHFDGPQIAERALEDGVWTITFQKELTGAYALSITAQVPVAKQAEEGKGYSFAVKVPVISPLDVVRASGLWAVEANTETEIRFDARGMSELDTLLAPQIADYAARHRVIGVFGWLGAEYALSLNGVRHAAAGMLTAVVDVLELNTVISTSGLHRHEAVYRLRASGVAYLDVALPEGARLLSVSVDGKAVKPVADRPGSVRLPLPARRDTDSPVVAAIVYETPGSAWKNRGTLALAAPAIAKEIPVLKSQWRVWVPEGFSFSDIESNLPVPEVQPENLLVRTIGEGAVAVVAAPFVRVYSAKDEREFAMARRESAAGAPTTGSFGIMDDPMRSKSATVRQLADHSVSVVAGQLRSAATVPNGEWASQPGMVRVYPPQTGEKRDLDELNRADLVVREWKFPGETADPKAWDWIADIGIVFGPGTSAAYNPTNGILRLKNTPEQLERFDKMLHTTIGKTNEAPRKAGEYQGFPGKPGTAAPKAPAEHFYDTKGIQKTAGLLPVSLDLPKGGPTLVFLGLYAPERLTMRYDDWWSRAQRLWLWFVGGGIAFYLVARGRPWWRTLWAALVLSAVPLCVSITWMSVCNALLGGWLAGLVLNRIGAWCVFRVRKEVAA
jgi:hypothetical protein